VIASSHLAVRFARGTVRVVVRLAAVTAVAIGLLVAVPAVLGFQTYAITTGSMTGTADAGSLVIAEPVPVTDLAVGDVITYLPPPDSGVDHVVTHRLVVVDEVDGVRTMRTQGDANATPDPWEFVLDDTLQPRMVVAVPYAGLPVLWLADATVRMLAIGLPAAVVALLSLLEVVRVFREPETPADGPAAVPDGGLQPATAVTDPLAPQDVPAPRIVTTV
jgi:signal peptidase I